MVVVRPTAEDRQRHQGSNLQEKKGIYEVREQGDYGGKDRQKHSKEKKILVSGRMQTGKEVYGRYKTIPYKVTDRREKKVVAGIEKEVMGRGLQSMAEDKQKEVAAKKGITVYTAEDKQKG